MSAKMNYKRTQDQVKYAKEVSNRIFDLAPFSQASFLAKETGTSRAGKGSHPKARPTERVAGALPISQSNDNLAIAKNGVKSSNAKASGDLRPLRSPHEKNRSRAVKRLSPQQEMLLRLHTRLGAAILENDMHGVASIASKMFSGFKEMTTRRTK
jgi:hypothetical protein